MHGKMSQNETNEAMYKMYANFSSNNEIKWAQILEKYKDFACHMVKTF